MRAPKPPTPPAFCSSCGSELAEDATFCSKCGKAVTPDQPDEPEPDKPQYDIPDWAAPDEKYHRSWITSKGGCLGLWGVFAFVVAILVVLAYQGSDGTDDVVDQEFALPESNEPNGGVIATQLAERAATEEAISQSGPADVSDLRSGDCFLSIPLGQSSGKVVELGAVLRVPCSVSHQFEVVNTVEIPLDETYPYPEPDFFDPFVEENCHELTGVVIFPSPESWAQGGRRILCIW